MSLINTIVPEEDVIYEEDFNEESSNTSSENEEEVYITKNMSVETILHSLTPIEYPPTSMNGVAIIFHVEGWQNANAAFTDIQYSMGKPCGQHNTTCSYLGNVAVTKKDRTCQGLKICEFASSELLEMTHETVDLNSDLRLKISEELSTDNVKNNTFVIYLAAIKTECRYKNNGIQCNGKAVLKCFRRHDEITSPTYFIGCSKWKSNEKYHRFINIQENIDLNLLHQLLNGIWEGESDEPINNCFTVLHNSSKKIYCSHPHCEGNIIKQGSIIQKTCNVKYSKLIPLDIKKCPYMILVSRGIHLHPPPPPNQVPITIRDRLQELIHQANDNTGDVTSTHIISGNLIKTYFGTEYLAEVHASLNNADRLRYHVDKIQKEINPQGTGLLGVVYNYSKNINNFCDYVKRLEFFEDNHVMIICTTPEQLNEWVKCQYFEIDLSFKRVAEEINEFEVNYYNLDHNLIITFARVFTNCATSIAYYRIFHSLFDLILQLTGLSPQFKHIYGNGWGCIIADLDYAQAKGLGMTLNEIDKTKNWEEHLVHILKSCQVHYKRKIRENRYDEIISNDMLAILSADSEDTINKLFDNILKNDENTASWVSFYKQTWVIGSLNKFMSKIDNEIWITTPNNTNVAEAAHALSNRRGKNLKLMTAIKQGYKLDKERLIVIDNNNKYNIPFRGRDKGPIARKISSNKRQANKLIKKIKTTVFKRKQNANASSSKKKLKRTITIESDIEDSQNEDNQSQENKKELKELEFQEKALALKERQLVLREREAKIHEIELNNLIKERELNK